MKPSKEAIKKAKRIMFKYDLCTIGCALALIVLLFFVIKPVSTLDLIFRFTVMIFLSRYVGVFLFRKIIFSVLTNRLDTETFLAISSRPFRFPPEGIWRLSAEYYSGNYNYVVSVCNGVLADPKTKNALRYKCLTLLANIFFDIGDDDNLRSVCKQFNDTLATEKQRKQQIITTRFSRTSVFEDYLDQNFDKIASTIEQPSHLPLMKHQRTFFLARTALLKQNKEEALSHFRALSTQVPQLNYGILASQIIDELQNADVCEYIYKPESTIKLTYTPLEKNPFDSKKHLITRYIGNAILIVSALYLICLNICPTKAELEYFEQVRLVVENDHDGVQVLSALNIRDENDIIESVAICQTDSKVLLVSLFHKIGQDECLYDTLCSFSTDNLLDGKKYVGEYTFNALTSDYMISVVFSTDKDEIPDNALQIEKFKVNGQRIYFAVTKLEKAKFSS